jgi:hypothetical protein
MAAVNLLARGYKFDVSTDGTNWVHPLGLDNLNDQLNPNVENANEYDSDGWSSSEITLYDWSLVTGMHRKKDAGVEDPGQKLIRDCRGEFGDEARLYVRWYRTDGIDEAWSGRAIVSVENRDTAVENIAGWTVTFKGDGPATKITNPFAESSAPVLTSALPSGAAEGDQVTIKGQGFTGTVPSTGVKFGAVAASSWVVVSDSVIVAVMPAGSAGSAAVTVTNATGVSNSLAYTRGA